jgi:hypothetical protein
MTPNAFRKLCLAASLVLAAGPVAAENSQGDEKRIDRLTDSMVVLMPFGTIFEGVAAADPTWPAMDRVDEISGRELVCLRGELSTQGYRRYAREQVRAYALANPDRLDRDIAMVEGGVAEMFGKLVLAGAEGERTGVPADPEQLLAGYEPAQLEAFMTFFSAQDYAGLRELAGLGNQIHGEKSAEENEAAGEQLGSALARKLMIRAMDTCGVELP